MFNKCVQMIALMGPSGAGKSTLMSILSGRQTPDSGSVFIGGHDLAGPERETLLRHTAFVMQDDQLIGSLTVEENISFAARLKVHGNAELRRARVNEMIEILGLEKVRHSPVGDVFRRGVSGGERKRVSIAIELVTHPSVIFLDEPTSGLDSSAALHVMTAVKRYATRLKSSVVAVIHQPPSSVFAMFSGILLLADGQTVYAGDPDAAAELFEDQGVDVPQNFNTAEVLLDTLAKPHFTSNEREKRRALDDIAAIRESYRGSSERKKMCARASSVVAGGHGVPLGGGGKVRVLRSEVYVVDVDFENN
jgi:ABC-type multidrug transport system ATPase subunit